jgi:hypothetical protein
MRTTLMTVGVVVALVLSLIALWLGTGVFRPDGPRPGVVFAGSWCCSSCTPGSLKCTGCKSASSSAVCAGTGLTGKVFVNCTGNTTEDTGTGTVNCY